MRRSSGSGSGADGCTSRHAPVRSQESGVCGCSLHLTLVFIFHPGLKSTLPHLTSDISFLYLANPSQSHSSPLIKPAQRSGLSDHFHGLTGPFPCCTLGRLLVACVPSARSKWLLRGSDALDELLCLRSYTPQPSTSMGLEVSDTERIRARIGPAHSFSPPCSAHATDPCSRA